jgi:hypothetical protein
MQVIKRRYELYDNVIASCRYRAGAPIFGVGYLGTGHPG